MDAISKVATIKRPFQTRKVRQALNQLLEKRVFVDGFAP